MSWVTALWSGVAGVCLTLAVFHGLVWRWRRDAWANAFFALTAIATVLVTFVELRMMRSQTPEQFATAVRWLHVPVWFLTIALLAFVRIYLRAGRNWIAWAVFGLRTLSLLLNFSTGVNLNYTEITGLRHISFLGEPVAFAIGVSNPWMITGQVSLYLLVFFLIDAAVAIWRRGDRRKALVVAGVTICIVGATVQAALAVWGVYPMPITVSLFYMSIIIVMGFELSRDVLRTSELSNALRESEQRLSLAAESANMGIWIRDFVRNEIWASDQWRMLFGFEKEERLELERILGRIHPDDREGVRQVLTDTMSADGRYETEYRVTLPEGNLRWISSRGRVEFNTMGKVTLVRGVSLDITARKQAEQEAQLLRQEVAHVGRVSMMGQLAAALAHEINQPLGAILRNAEAGELFMQHKSPDLEEIRAILADIRKDDERASAVIERMRSLLRRQELEKREVDVSGLIGDVVEFVRSDAVSRRVRVEVEIPEDLPLVLGDRVHLQQVLLNLIINGMDAVHNVAEERRCIVVRAWLDNPSAVGIAVSDTGPGIPSRQLAHVFDSFFTTKAGGMGMGLPISRTIVEAHGGRLLVETVEGSGATFRFTLPTSEGN